MAPWLEALPYLDEVKIKNRVEHFPEPLLDLARDDPFRASKRLSQQLRELFVASSSTTQALFHLYNKIRSSAPDRYPSIDHYLAHLQQGTLPEDPPSLTCLVGLAGIGKSRLLRKLEELVRYPESSFHMDNIIQMPLKGMVRIVIGGRTTLKRVFQRVQQDLGIPLAKGRSADDALEETYFEAFRQGVLSICCDEMQHSTMSDANVLVTNILFAVGKLTAVSVVGCNFSLIRRLDQRRQEDRHRLLNSIIEIRPAVPDSEDWLQLLSAVERVAPDTLGAISRYQALLGTLTHGVPRHVDALVTRGYLRARIAGREVLEERDLRAAYEGQDYSAFRTDVEDLNQLVRTGATTRSDLTLPKHLQDRGIVNEALAQRRALDDATSRQIFYGMLTAGESAAARQLAKRSPPQAGAPKAKISASQEISDDDLVAGLALLKKEAS